MPAEATLIDYAHRVAEDIPKANVVKFDITKQASNILPDIICQGNGLAANKNGRRGDENYSMKVDKDQLKYCLLTHYPGIQDIDKGYQLCATIAYCKLSLKDRKSVV